MQLWQMTSRRRCCITKECESLKDYLPQNIVQLPPQIEARDTPEVLKEYLAHFSDNIAGLSGTAEETAAIAKAYV